jgi:hypothetical protein
MNTSEWLVLRVGSMIIPVESLSSILISKKTPMILVLMYVFMFEPGEVPKQFLLFSGKVDGCSNVNNDDLISTSPASQLGNPFTVKPENIARLGSLGDKDLFGTIKGWRFERCTQGSLHKGNRNVANYIVFISFKELVGLNKNLNIQVAWGSTTET